MSARQTTSSDLAKYSMTQSTRGLTATAELLVSYAIAIACIVKEISKTVILHVS